MLIPIPSQIDGFIKKQKKLILMASTNEERSEAFGFWCGFLNGLRMTGSISKEEYKELYKEMINFEKRKIA